MTQQLIGLWFDDRRAIYRQNRTLTSYFALPTRLSNLITIWIRSIPEPEMAISFFIHQYSIWLGNNGIFL